MFETTEFWLIVTAIIFTVVGFRMGNKSGTRKGVSGAIDSMIEQGYIKTRKNSDGSTEILKHNEG